MTPARFACWIDGRREAVLVIAAVAVLFADAGVSEIHGTALFYARLAREIAEAGDPLAVFTGERAYLLKPPLALWLSAAGVGLLGPSGLGASLASRAFGVVAVVLTAAVGRRLYGPAAGCLGALILLTNSTFVQFTVNLRMESLLASGMLLALLGYLDAERRWGPAAVGGGIASAVMAKGPAGLGPLALLPLHAWVAGRRLRPGRRWMAAGVLLAIPALWYGLMFHLHGSAPAEQLASDALRGGHADPVEQLVSALDAYVIKPLRRYWPGLPFMVAGVWLALRELRRPPDRAGRARAVLMLGWVTLVVVVVAAKPDHDVRYLYPALPALAILGGWALASLCGARAGPVSTAVAAALAVLALACWPFRGALFDDAGPAIAQMHRIVDERLPPAEAVPVVGMQITDLQGPSRQSEHRDWVYFYLRRRAELYAWNRAEAGMFAGEPLVMIGKTPDRDALAARLALRPVVGTETMLLTEPLARRGTEQPGAGDAR